MLPQAHSRLPSRLSVHLMLTCDNVTSFILINPIIDNNKAQALAQIHPQPFEGEHVQEFKDAQV